MQGDQRSGRRVERAMGGCHLRLYCGQSVPAPPGSSLRSIRLAVPVLMLAASLPALAACSKGFSVSVTRSTPTPTAAQTATPALTPTPTVDVEVTVATEERATEAAEPAPTIVPAPTATPTPMSAPEPTATPVPVPTATPTETPCPSPDESAYTDRLHEAESSWVQTTTAFGELAFQVGNDPSLLNDQEWSLGVRSVLSTLQADAQRIREIQPGPASVHHIHAEMEEIAALVSEGVVVFGRGLEDGDPALVARGNRLFQQAAGIRGTVAGAVDVVVPVSPCAPVDLVFPAVARRYEARRPAEARPPVRLRRGPATRGSQRRTSPRSAPYRRRA